MYQMIFSLICAISPGIVVGAQDREKPMHYSLPHEFFVQQNDILIMVHEIHEAVYSLEKDKVDTEKLSSEKLQDLDAKLDILLKLFEEKNKPQEYHDVWKAPVKKGESK